MALVVGVLVGERLFRDCLREALETNGCKVPVAAGDPPSLLAGVRAVPVEVLVLEVPGLSTPAPDFAELLTELSQSFPEVPVVLLTVPPLPGQTPTGLAVGVAALADRAGLSLLELLSLLGTVVGGGRAVAINTLSSLSSPALRAELSPESAGPLFRLTVREKEVLGQLGLGKDNLKIAAVLGISERGVRAHVSNLYRKLDCENRAEMALFARRFGLCQGLSS